ncbi:MAG TPA: protein kinase, partial [Gemmatimonadaceae bacterium]|nr:protein kinase [Gemmatimonadaceae bacterium]
MTDELSTLLARIVVPSDDVDVERRWEKQLGRVVLGRFRLQSVLGRGGFGIVFEALDEQLGRKVAFKVLRARNANQDELLRREARVVAGFQHPNIVTLHDAGRAKGSWYLVLELLRGETLAARLGRGHLPVEDAIRIASAIAAGLQHAHAAGVLHRDLKPANVFLTIDGGVKVLDFGLSRAPGAEPPAGGTSGYLAPEQRRREDEDPRTDLFALGVVLAEMTTPRDAWRPRVTDGVPEVDVTAAPQPLQSIISRWTSADVARRPRSAAAAISELRELVSALEPPDASSRARAVEAALQLGRAEARAAQPLFGQECDAEYEKALATDPTLAVAHYQRAIWRRRFGGTANEQRAPAKAALRYIANAPPIYRALIRAFVAQLDGRVEQATRMLREAADAFPGDARASYELADLLRHEDELELCLPWLRRTLSLQPDHGWALGQFAEVLGALGRRDKLRRRLARWEAERSTLALHAVSIARGWLGDFAGAEEAAARAVALGGGLVAKL